MHVLIVGSGIGGLTAALCCRYFGHDVTLFEQAAHLGEIGAGIQIPPNAMKVFEALGIDSLIAENAFLPEAIETRMGETGRPIFSIPLAQKAVELWGSPYLHIHRADFIKALSHALAMPTPTSLELRATVTGYCQDSNGVSVTLDDGRKFAGDVIIGADGVRSTIRTQMLGPENPVFTGNVAWRAIVPIENLGTHAPSPTACAWMGRGRHAVTYRLRRGALANFVGVVERQDWTQEGWAVRGTQEEALKDFAGWHPTIETMIKTVQPQSLFRWALFDRTPLSSWVEGRVVLLGDAAHPMLPFMAQGAAMAVEDGWALAHALSQPGRSIQDRLITFQRVRFKRTSRIQASSRANMKTFHQRSVFGQLKTYGPMWLAGKMAPRVVHQRLDWLYRFDVTKPCSAPQTRRDIDPR